MSVLPAPVGAQINIFSGDLKAVSNTLVYILFNSLIFSGKTPYTHLGNYEIFNNGTLSSLCFIAGTIISS